MDRIIQQNKDEMKVKYIVVVMFSYLTGRKIKWVEKYRMELKELVKQHEKNKGLYNV
ncbi:hypothetical protein [Radiobacillus deserti]|uniref:hypothetical protein n=1 Tax=Radiobacillus deserti TaxID=2594883 RepID=UPI00131531EC|nr:hypothetical protein [Radiobacillus deserti]